MDPFVAASRLDAAAFEQTLSSDDLMADPRERLPASDLLRVVVLGHPASTRATR